MCSRAQEEMLTCLSSRSLSRSRRVFGSSRKRRAGSAVTVNIYYMSNALNK